MKQLVQFKRIFAAVLLLTVSTISWANGTKINGIYYVLDSSTKTASVTYTGTTSSNNPSSTAYTGSITIPSTVTYNSTTYSVTSIGIDAFSGCSGLTSVTIPNSVTSIGNYAFLGCSSLTSITIPNSVTSIGFQTFYNCSGLTKAEFASIESLCKIEFGNDTSNLFNETSNPLYYAHNLYINGQEITDLVIPNSVTSIGRNAFSGCIGLTSVNIPNSVTSIGQDAFSGCSNLTSIVVDKDNTYYDSRDNCNAIIQTSSNTLISGCKNTVIPSSVTSIGDNAFYKCSGLKSLTIPESVTSIGYAAFCSCDNLTSITIPNSVTIIGSSAFASCKGLTSITIPNSVTNIGSSAFFNCSRLKEVYCMAIQVPSTESNAFDNTNIASATLYVPEKAVNAYKSTAPWSKFRTFVKLNYDFVADGIYYNINSDGTSVSVRYKNTSYNSYSGSLVIPATVTYNGKQYSVTSIDNSAFRDCSGLKSVTIPSSVTSIGEEAFRSCSGLTSVTINSDAIVSKTYTSSSNLKTIFGSQVKEYIIGDAITSIGSYAFYGCSGLTSITIPNSVTSIGEYAFYICSSLTKAEFASIESLCKIAFGDSNANPLLSAHHLYIDGQEVTDVVIPNSVTSIGDYAFRGCSSLTSITIPESVTSIGSYAFCGCSGLTSITIPESVTSIGYQAFSSCSGLTSIVVDKDNTYYDSRDNCNAIIQTSSNTLISGCKNTVIPSSVTSIGDHAFYGCSGLTSITIPESVTNISDYAFTGCSGLKEVYCMARQVPTTGTYVFYNTSIASATLYVPEKAVNAYKSTAPWSSFGTFVELNYDFMADGLYYSINADGTSVTVTYKTTSYNSYSGSLVIPATITYSGKQYNVTSIDNSAFRNCSGLTSVTIPESVTSIGAGAFSYCSGLTSVTIPESVTSIGFEAFYNCKGLTSVIIPNSVTSIGNYAFESCSGLTSIKVNTGNPVYDSRDNCNAIIQTSSNTLISGCKSTVIPNSVTSIGVGAFSNCKGLTSVIIPNSVTSIGERAFYNCSGLTSITIPNSVTSIGNYAFAYCSSLKEVYCMAKQVPSTASNAFNNTNIASATLYVRESAIDTYKSQAPWSGFGTFKALDDFDFVADGIYYNINSDGASVTVTYKTTSYNSYSGSIVIPDTVTYSGKQYNVTSIDNSAFRDCSGLTSITIPESVTSIGNNAFYNCTGLTSVTINSNAIVSNTYTSSNNIGTIFGTQVQEYIIGEDVTSIGNYVFRNCSDLTSVTIPESVTSIGDRAFYGCSGLTSITIPSSVTNIGSSAFYGCSGLTSVTIPSSVTSIGEEAFRSCSGLTSIVVDKDNTYYDSRDNCNAIIQTSSNTLISGCKNTVIPNSVTSIGSYAFYGCSGLTSITIPESVTSIGNYAFAYCSSLKEVYCMAKQVPSTASNAFNNTNIASARLYVPASAVDAYKSTTPWRGFGTIALERVYDFEANGICYYVNSNATSVTITYRTTDYNSYSGSVVIPSTVNYSGKQYSVTGIGKTTFYNCSGLKSVTIPSSVTSIGEEAFRGCSGLKSITIPNSVTSIGDSVFYDCSGLTSITIPTSVKSIGYSALKNCAGLKSITIPTSVTSIGDDAFSGCSGLTSVTINSNAIVSNTYTSSSNLETIFGSQVKEYIIGDAITSMGAYVFYNCCNLTSITIPNNVKSIGNYAFYNCYRLTSITIPNSVTSIGSYAFSGCSGLTSVTIPNSVTSIGNYAFAYCYRLTSITIPNSVTSIGSYAFYGCSGLTSVTIPNSVTSIGKEAFEDCSGLKSITIPNSVASIGEKAFRYCSGLKSVTIPESVTSIGDYAFNGCTGLTSVTINSNQLVSKTYTSSSNLGKAFNVSADIILGNNVTSIGDYVFYSGSSLKSITIPNSVTYIGNDAFPTNTNCKIYIDKSAYALGVLWDKGIIPYDKATKAYLTIPSASMINSASSIRLTGTTYSGGMEMTSQSYTVSGTTKTGNSASFTGLTPGTSYPVAYKATVRYGGNTLTYTRNYTMSTSELTLTTSQPKVISAGNAIVEATSNLDDEEENAGFEWRRTDWTADFSSNTGAAYLYEGTMEGYIRNLYTEKLWKVRPYYRDNNGTYYYGEWVGLDPTNTSYFEPTVHTYAKISVTGNKASLSGYVQRGSDNVSKQGFKYWADASGARGAGITIPTSAKTVEAEGRIMEAELTGLLPNTTYSYVAFVTTTEGETFYGKQLTFTTEDDPDAAVLGDANGNGVVEIGDVTSVLTLMATPEATGYNNKAADANQNGVIEIGDVTTILTIMAGGN